MAPFKLNPEPAARSLQLFGLYLCVAGGGLLLAPALVLAPLGLALPQDVWIRIVGIVALALGTSDVLAAQNSVETLIHWSVWRRLVAGLAIGALVLAGVAPTPVAAFAAVDIAAALWTALLLRQTPVAEPLRT